MLIHLSTYLINTYKNSFFILNDLSKGSKFNVLYFTLWVFILAIDVHMYTFVYLFLDTTNSLSRLLSNGMLLLAVLVKYE